MIQRKTPNEMYSKPKMVPFHRSIKINEKKSVDELYDDVLRYVFSFLNYRDLFRVGRVNQRWRKLSESDILWDREYANKNFVYVDKPNVKSQFKRNFVECLKDQKIAKMNRKVYVSRLNQVQKT